MSHSLFCFLVLVTIPAGASADEPTEPSPNDAAPPRGVTEHDIVPILQLRCVVCHGKRRREAGLDLRSRESILRGGKSGAVIVLGKPEESLLIQRIVSGDMPPVAEQQDLSVRPVAAGELRRITAWIESGAPRSPPEYYEAQHGADLQLTDEDRAFWSCTPPKRPRVPKVDNSSLVRNPIDAFLLEKLEEAGLTFSPEAERPTLIRRLSFDLIGLPPEPEEVAAFVADDSPGAYYDLVDRWEVISHELDVLCTTLMATTIGCARCHDHKYDPIPQSDFYSMAAIFTTALDPHDWLRPMERYVDTAPAEELLAWQAEHEKAQDKAAKLAAALEVQAQPLRQELLKERLEAIPEEIRDDVQSANKTPAGKRSPIHKYLVSKFQDKLKVDKIALAGRFPELKSAADGAEEAMAEVKQHARQKPQIRAAFEMGGEPSPVYLHVRGDPLSPGHLVEPRPLAMFSDPSYPYAIQPPWQHDGSSGRRLAFARWLTSPNHPVTTRVLVNRLWHRHFGKGIVPTLGNFGRTGARPTHPELLDWLALEFGAHWSLKSMHRWMVTSTAYRQQSQQTRDLQRKDPQNSLLSRMPLRRLDAEAVRDALLKISGELNPSLFGPILHVEVAMDGNVVVKDTRQGRRRSIYIQQRRTTPLTILETFDKPVLNPNCLIRRGSIVAAQALQMMNSETVRSQAMHFARRVAAEAVGTKAQVTHAYLLALGRAPDSRDLQMAESTLDTLRDEWIAQLREEAEEAPGKTEEALGETGLTATGDATGAKGDPRTEGELRAEAELRALASLCHTLLNSGEFLYLD